jgi:hypothetical protein
MTNCNCENCTCESEIDFKQNERELVLSKLLEAVEYLFKKCLKGNIRDEKKDKIRVTYFRTLAYTCSIYNQISRDNELDELKEDIEDLKQFMRNKQ